MLIVSDFHDYYDIVLGEGINKTIVYNRKQKEIEFSRELFKSVGSDIIYNTLHNIAKEIPSTGYRDDSIILKNGDRVTHEFFIIGFCGKLYVGVKIEYKYYKPLKRNTNQFMYGFDDIFELCSNYGIIKTKKENLKKLHYGTTKQLIDCVEKYHNVEILDLFRTIDVPIFYISRWKAIVNPRLKDLEFGKMFNSIEAFQELYMFLGEKLNKEKPIIIISDKDKLLQHGFDDKWSFRNPDPPKRKQK
jgi:hypothetical protein